MTKPLRIALTKGRLEQKTLLLFKNCGIECDSLYDKGRKLVFPIDCGRMEVMLVKSNDVITYVEHGTCDLGIVGKDSIMEHGKRIYEIADLGFGNCTMALAAPVKKDDVKSFFDGYTKKIIATKFEKIARDYFSQKQMDIEIVKIEGSVELAPILGLADGIVDIVETGVTLKENGLETVESICPISARLIANIASMKLKKTDITGFINRLKIKYGGICNDSGN